MKNVITIFNKCEDFDPNNLDKRFYKYIGESHHFVSAYHKLGLEELLLFTGSLSVTEFLTDEITTSLTIVGRPNAGKSTLFNSLLNNERSTVSDVPGTTRDKIKEALKLNDRTYSIVDTAGVPRKKQKDQIDRYSSQLAINSLENAHIALIVIDSTEGLSFEDKRILKSAIEENVTPVLILNKWDKLNTQERDDINKSVKRDLKQYKWISLIRISALNKKNINLISKQLDLIEQQLSKRITTSELNTHFRSLWTKNPPHPFRGKRAKLKYVTQYSTFPPEFAFTLSGRIPKNYEAFIENYVRDVFKMNLISFRIKINA
jgi:GTP-binding protein